MTHLLVTASFATHNHALPDPKSARSKGRCPDPDRRGQISERWAHPLSDLPPSIFKLPLLPAWRADPEPFPAQTVSNVTRIRRACFNFTHSTKSTAV